MDKANIRAAEEAKGVASLPESVCTKRRYDDVEASPDRLVRHVQRRLLSVGRSKDIPPRDVALLEDRVRRLKATSDRFDYVRLSPHVTAKTGTFVHDRVRGVCVAREV